MEEIKSQWLKAKSVEKGALCARMDQADIEVGSTNGTLS